MDAITLRSIERIVAVLIGGASIYLGYQLFLAIPERRESEGKIGLPGGVSIYLTRIGPGAFFALFGAIVVAISIQQAVTYSESSETAPADSVQSEGATSTSVNYTGFGRGTAGTLDLESRRLQVANDLTFLRTTLPQMLRSDARAENRTDLDVLIPRAKLAMIQGVWDSPWGDFAAFKEWVEAGAAEPVPPNFRTPADWFRGGRP